MTKEYIIKPIVKAKFSGISALSKSRTVFTGAEMDKNGSYKTGLTVEEERKFEEELGLPKNHLSKKNEAFWGHLEFRLNNDKPTTFLVESTMDEIRWRALIGKSKIALNELEITKNPMALFYVEDKEAKAKVVEKRADLKLEALELFTDMSADERRGLLKIYGIRGAEAISDRQIKATLFEKIESDVDKFLSLMKDKNLQTRITIEDLLEKGMLTKKGNYYVYEGESLGSSIEGVVTFFNDPKNQSIKIALTQEAKAKNKSKE